MPQPLTKSQQKLLKLFGERVAAIRIQKGLTLEQVGHKIGKDKQSIHRLEKGSFNPSFIYLFEVCKGLDIELSELMKDL
jgi:transcriptional regulator with XRE-family HTH domain